MYNGFVMWRALVLHWLGRCRLEPVLAQEPEISGNQDIRSQLHFLDRSVREGSCIPIVGPFEGHCEHTDNAVKYDLLFGD